MTACTRILHLLAEISRGPRSKIVVSLDEGANGAQFVSIKRWCLLAGNESVQEAWHEIRGVALQLEDLAAVAAALLRATERTK